MQEKSLLLIPTTLGGNKKTIPSYVSQACLDLDAFIVENVRSARRFLRSIGYAKNFDEEVSFYELNKHSQDHLEALYVFLNQHKNMGLLSEAGNPCIADPGAIAVALCHDLKIKVKPLVGPSSILLALIASGFDGQKFSFHGYLPIPNTERNHAIKKMENELKKTGYTQIFMETPYRNEKMIKSLLSTCHKSTKLSIAADISLESEHIETRTIENWSHDKPNYHKRPAIFILGN